MGETLPPGIQVRGGQKYGNNGVANQLDLYLPQKMRGKIPVIVWIHGGGWESGNKEPCPAVFLVDKGYAVASINYRLSDDGAFPAQIHDCKDAVRWLRANAERYNLDPDRIGVFGASSGGHLAALLGTSSDKKELEGTAAQYPNISSKVQAVCDVSGPTDLKKFAAFSATMPGIRADAPKQMVAKLLGGDISGKQGLAEQASPITYVSPKSPPFLIMHGEDDTLVPPEQSKLLTEALKAAHVDVELQLVPHAGHQIAPRLDMRRIEQFFDKQLRNIDAKERDKGDEPEVVATFSHKPGTGAPSTIKFYENGRLGSPDSLNTWTLDGNTLVLCWYDHRAPNWVWVDTCTLDKEGKSFEGQNQKGTSIRGVLTDGGNLRDVTMRSPAADVTLMERKDENISTLSLDAALGRATGARWKTRVDGFSIPLAGVNLRERKDMASRFTQLLAQEIGSTKGLSYTPNAIVVDKALAQKIVDKFVELQAKDKTLRDEAAKFIRKFSGADAVLSQTNFERARADAQHLADSVKEVPGLDKPEIKMNTRDALLAFTDQDQANRFADVLIEARKQVGLTKEALAITAPEMQKIVVLKYGDLNNLSEKEAAAFFNKVTEILIKEKGKDAVPGMSMTVPDPVGRLQVVVDDIEKQFGGIKPDKEGMGNSAQLLSPRLIARTVPTNGKGPIKI